MRLFKAWHERNAPRVIDRGAVRALLAEGGEAEAHRLALGLPCADGIEVESSHRPAQRFRIVAAVEHLAHQVAGRHRVGRYEIGEADRLGRDAELAREGS